jgi:hypothetical protein
MTELLSRLFVKNHDRVSDPTVRRGYGTLASVTGIVFNLLLYYLSEILWIFCKNAQKSPAFIWGNGSLQTTKIKIK